MENATAKEFHISDILSIMVGRLVSRKKIRGVYDLLEFLAGDDAYRRQIPEMLERCKPHLITQFPKFKFIDWELEAEELDKKLKGKSGKTSEKIIAHWLEMQALRFAETFQVRPIPI